MSETLRLEKERENLYYVGRTDSEMDFDSSKRPSRRRQPGSVHDLLCFAIDNKRLVEFQYKGLLRIAEPHDYGIIDGVGKLLVYQLGGESRSGSLPDWRTPKVADIRGLQVLEETFPGGRSVPSGKHKKWEKLFKRVSSPSGH